jgi:hypothetical protein
MSQRIVRRASRFALLLLAAVAPGIQAQTYNITFDAGDPINGLTVGTVLGSQYAAATGATFTPNAFTGSTPPPPTQPAWATNTDVTVVSSTGADVGGLGTPTLVSGNILRSFNGWLGENGDPSIRMTLANPASTVSIDFAGIATATSTRLIAFNAGGTQVGTATAAGTGQQTLTVTAAGIASVAILPGDFDDWVGVDNIRFTLEPVSVPPTLAYAPAAGSPINFTGVTTSGSTGSATLTVTPSAGSGTGAGATTTLNGCTVGGADAASFAGAGAINLTFTGAATTAQAATLTCTSGPTARNATLTCNRTAGTSAPVQVSWPLACPAGTVALQPVDTLSDSGRMLAIVLVLLAGLVAVPLVRRNA